MEMGVRLCLKLPIAFAAQVDEPLAGIGDTGHLVRATGLDQQYSDVEVLRQAAGNHRSGRTRATDDVVIGLSQPGPQLTLIVFDTTREVRSVHSACIAVHVGAFEHPSSG